MDTKTPLLVATLLLASTAHAAPKPDPKLFGHWQGVADLKAPAPSHLDLVLRPNAAATMTGTQAGDTFIGQATYTTKSGVLVLTYVKYTQNGRAIVGHQTQDFKYTVTPTTLSLDDRTSDGPVIFHRITP